MADNTRTGSHNSFEQTPPWHKQPNVICVQWRGDCVASRERFIADHELYGPALHEGDCNGVVAYFIGAGIWDDVSELTMLIDGETITLKSGSPGQSCS